MADFKVGAMRTQMEETMDRLKQRPKSTKRDALIKKLDKAMTALDCGQTMVFDI